MRAIGFFNGLLGDQVISTVAARIFKQLNPGSHLTLGINQRYAQIAPLFYQHPYYDTIHLYSAYDDWPDDADKAYLAAAKYDKVFNAMPQHTREDWFLYLHQTQEACVMHGLPYPKDLANCQCVLTPWWQYDITPRKDYVAISPIGAFYQNYPNVKSYTPAQVATIVNHIKSLGYGVLQIRGPGEPQFDGCEVLAGSPSYLESVKAITACKALITVDTSINWTMSSFSFPVMSCYARQHYGDGLKSIQPVNPNAVYLDGQSMSDITDEQIIAGVDRLLRDIA